MSSAVAHSTTPPWAAARLEESAVLGLRRRLHPAAGHRERERPRRRRAVRQLLSAAGAHGLRMHHRRHDGRAVLVLLLLRPPQGRGRRRAGQPLHQVPELAGLHAVHLGRGRRGRRRRRAAAPRPPAVGGGRRLLVALALRQLHFVRICC
jgi:hypothetical protein